MRQDEAALAAAISDALPGSFERISAGGSTLTRRDAISLLAGLAKDGDRRGG
jgi:hypothetical protein